MNPKIARLITEYQKENNEEALITLWEAFRPLVISTMRKFYIPIPQQEDISQEAFLRLLECAHTYDIEQNVPFESYYKMRLHYWFLNRIRQKTDLLVVDHDWSSGVSMTDLMESTIGNAQELIELSELQEKLQQALTTLTPKQKQAVIMYHVHGIPLTEIAKKMNCSYKVAFKHKDAGLKKMKKKF